ncbi:MAG: 4-hydroxy-3-methylbut-2-enyl diphosphate reductase [Candidatus Omnitrophica bacterium]|nr:4-hydroxy-3-methylbut-2-enyl diphosphate reductase [Candidatus Omnitrophota bacterium]
MKINIGKSAGFCLGVRRAINIALDIARQNLAVYMLGDIVHNEDVVRDIQKAGIKKIKKLTTAQNKTLLIRAHGAGKETFKRARRLGYKIIDATCPMVKGIHKIARDMEKKGYKIIIIGDKDHDEVKGIAGDLKKKAIIIDNLRSITLNKIKKIKKAAAVVQSTQDLEKVLKIIDCLLKFIPNLKFFNTICKPTRTKQQEIRKMPLENDVMIIIGSKNSANTKRLYEISKSLNKRSYWINSRQELKKRWLDNAKSVGIAAGASTPQTAIQDVVNYIKNLNLGCN